MFCTNCGANNSENTTYCVQCGAALSAGLQSAGVNQNANANNANSGSGMGGSGPAYNINRDSYGPPLPQYNNANSYNNFSMSGELEEPVSTKEFFCAQLWNFIPFVGSLIYLIMLFVWGFGGNAKKSKANWAKAQLIWMGISLGLGFLIFIFIIIVFGSLGAALSEYNYYM